MHQLYLSHHGIKGQKWGLRRFQNPDGSVTSKGAQRYYSEYGDNYRRSDDPQNAPNKTETKKKGLTDKQKKALIIAGAATLAVVGGVALYKSGALNKVVSGSILKGKKFLGTTKYASINKSTSNIPSKQLSTPIKKTISTPQNINKPRVTTSDLHKAVAKSPVNRVEIPKTAIPRTEVKRVEVPKVKVERTEIPRTKVNLTFGENDTFSSSDMKRMQANFNKAFGSASSATKSAWTNEGQDFANELLKKNMKSLGF